MPVVAGVNIWQYLGFNMLFFFAGLQGDTAAASTRRRRSTGPASGASSGASACPCSTPPCSLSLVTDVIGSFQVFDTLYVLTAGGPGDSTKVMSLNIYNIGFTDYRLGEAAALSVLLFGVILIFSVGQFMFFRNRTTYDYSS